MAGHPQRGAGDGEAVPSPKIDARKVTLGVNVFLAEGDPIRRGRP